MFANLATVIVVTVNTTDDEDDDDEVICVTMWPLPVSDIIYLDLDLTT